jgi:hypothetical protein
MLVRQISGSLVPWTGEAINEVSYPAIIEQLWSDQQLADIGLKRVIPFEVPDGFVATGPRTFIQNDDGMVSEHFDIVPVGSNVLKDFAADQRYSTEIGGITVGNVRITTDEVSQRKISELRRRTTSGEISVPFGFKSAQGWVDLSVDQITAIDQAIAQHIESCYAVERTVSDSIDASTITTFKQISDAFAALTTTR